MTEAERTAAALRVWRSEKAQALTIIILGWVIKVRRVPRWFLLLSLSLVSR